GDVLFPMLTSDARGLFAVDRGDVVFIDLVSGLTSVIAKGPIKPFPAVLGVRGSTAFYLAEEGKVRLWDATTGRARQDFDSAGQLGLGGNAAALSPDGKQVVLLGSAWTRSGQMAYYNSSQIYFCDAATGQRKRRWQTSGARFESSAWSADGRYLLVGGLSMGTFEDEKIEDALPFSAKSGLLLFDARTGEPLRSIEPVSRQETRPYMVTAAAFSPDGLFFAIGQIDGSAHVYELITGRPIRSFRGHRNRVSQLVFTANSRRLVTVGDDMMGLVWDTSPAGLAKPEELGTAEQRERTWGHLALLEWELAGP